VWVAGILEIVVVHSRCATLGFTFGGEELLFLFFFKAVPVVCPWVEFLDDYLVHLKY